MGRLPLLREAIPLWKASAFHDAARELSYNGAALAAATEDAKALRLELLTRLKSGEHIELELACTPFLQHPDESNRNFIRFRPSALRPMGKSGVNSVFLRDHRQRELLARGGTVTSSRMDKAADGVYRLSQRIHIHEAWAVQLALTGSIDRFSIGWWPTGPITCSVCGTEILDECWHWPGDVVGASTIEWVYHSAELIETSAVCVPAVVGTTADDIRAALAQHLDTPVEKLQTALAAHRGISKRITAPGQLTTSARPSKKDSDMGLAAICRQLGLKDEASEQAVHERVGELLAHNQDLETQLNATVADRDRNKAELATANERADKAEADLAEERTAIAEREADAVVEEAIASGKCAPADDVASWIRATCLSQGPEKTRKIVSALGTKTPVGAPRQSSGGGADAAGATAQPRLLAKDDGAPDFAAMAKQPGLFTDAEKSVMDRRGVAPAVFLETQFAMFAKRFGWSQKRGR